MKRILFIDDDTRHVRYYMEYLELEGFQVDCVESDKAALDYIENNRDSVGLIILDIIMPSKDLFTWEETQHYKQTGVKLFPKIQAILPKVPVIVLTIRDDQKIKEELEKMGAKAYLVKDKTAPSVLCEKVKIHFLGTS